VKKVAIGSIVHFVRPDGDHRPGVVVRVWDKETGLVNTIVFIDGSNDQPEVSGQLVRWVTSVRYSDQYKPRTWHWPEEA